MKNVRIPIAVSVPLETDAQAIYRAVRFQGPSILLESARTHPVTGRYSILAGEPDLTENSLKGLDRRLSEWRAARVPGLPPFVGGAIGALQYDARPPEINFLFFSQALVIDHLEGKLWSIALSDPRLSGKKARDEALARANNLLERATRPFEPLHPSTISGRTEGSEPWRSTHTRESFEAMVRCAKEHIAAGEIYQANLSQRFDLPWKGQPWELYRRLTRINPSPFAAFADFGFVQVISASPERLWRCDGRQIETRPIAGTRPRGATSVETARLRTELLLNEKERAEHLMLVDLERNDLGRVCDYGTVHVDDLMAVEEYSHVIHIVSNVRGELREEVRPSDLIAALFPGGTITGCPKIRCMQIIDELEPVKRRWYTGSLGYFSASGDSDFNILIRTAVVEDGRVTIQAGAGIVADSDPGREYEETLHKARALKESIGSPSDPLFV